MRGDDVDNDSGGLNSFFDQNGFESRILVKNLGSTFVYLGIFLFAINVYVITNFLGRKIKL